MPEQQLKKQIVEWLNYNGIFAWPTNTGVFFFKGKDGKSRCFRSGMKGMPDIIGIMNGGIFLAIETKMKYKKATVEQNEFIKRITKNGGIAFVAYSLDEVIKHLKDYL